MGQARHLGDIEFQFAVAPAPPRQAQVPRSVDAQDPTESVMVSREEEAVTFQVYPELQGHAHHGEAFLLGDSEFPLADVQRPAEVDNPVEAAVFELLKEGPAEVAVARVTYNDERTPRQGQDETPLGHEQPLELLECVFLAHRRRGYLNGNQDPHQFHQEPGNPRETRNKPPEDIARSDDFAYLGGGRRDGHAPQGPSVRLQNRGRNLVPRIIHSHTQKLACGELESHSRTARSRPRTRSMSWRCSSSDF